MLKKQGFMAILPESSYNFSTYDMATSCLAPISPDADKKPGLLYCG